MNDLPNLSHHNRFPGVRYDTSVGASETRLADEELHAGMWVEREHRRFANPSETVGYEIGVLAHDHPDKPDYRPDRLTMWTTAEAGPAFIRTDTFPVGPRSAATILRRIDPADVNPAARAKAEQWAADARHGHDSDAESEDV